MARREENFSVFVSNTLDAIGYRWEMVKLRQDSTRHKEGIINANYCNFDQSLIVAGSKREGVITLLGGDNDHMFESKEVIVTETVPVYLNQPNLTVLKLVTTESSPGYALLTLAKHGGRLAPSIFGDELASLYLQMVLGSCLATSDTSECYPVLASDIFFHKMEAFLQIGFNLHGNVLFPSSLWANNVYTQARAGPSIPLNSDLFKDYVQVPNDTVFTLACHCPSVFEGFRMRQRKHGWPSDEVLKEISQLEAHVVPVGFKRSPFRPLEWRICFTKAEIRLIECLTEPQIHVFVLLKIFAKDVLKDVWDVFTSYIMKNLILWMAELIPGHKFRKDTIVDRFLDCLFFLRRCVESGHLPNYMIAERNLLSHDTFVVKQRKVLSFLNNCLMEKGTCLLRSPRLKVAMLNMMANPRSTVQYGVSRDATEKAALSMLVQGLPHLNDGTSMQDILRLVLSGWGSELLKLCLERFSFEEIVCDPSGTLNRILGMVVSHLQ